MLSKIFQWELLTFSGFSVGHHNLVYPPGIIRDPNKNARTISNGTSTARNNDTNYNLQPVLFTNQRTAIISLGKKINNMSVISDYASRQSSHLSTTEWGRQDAPGNRVLAIGHKPTSSIFFFHNQNLWETIQCWPLTFCSFLCKLSSVIHLYMSF